MRLGYVVSRFPQVSETFIVREMDAVRDAGDFDIKPFSLFGVRPATVHPAARPWLAQLDQGRFLRGCAALAWWFARRPLRLTTSLAAIIGAYGRHPSLALRALVAAVIAAQHARTLARDPVDHVHAHFATYPALAAWLWWRLTGIGYSFTAHAHDLYVDQSMLERKADDARFVVTVSEFNRRFIRAHVPDSVPVHVVHCGVDPREYEFHARPVPAHDQVTAVCVASLQEYKGHRVLLRALASRAELERVFLELIGDGVLRDPLERETQRLGLAHRVRFAGSLVDADVRERLQAADVFVLPSVVASDGQMEGLPVALMEAMAAGLPVVASRLSGIPELVIDGETGLLSEPGDPDSLAGALARTLADPEASRRRAKRARAKIVQEFDVLTSGRRLATLFQQSRRVAEEGGTTAQAVNAAWSRGVGESM
jgi:colanic acid/amylovoran biosynthesis glycosyltransferase